MACVLLFLSVTVVASKSACASDTAVPLDPRPNIGMFRWQENWSFLSDPAAKTNFADSLKYIPLDTEDPLRYISFGLTLRERYENKNDPSFGINHTPNKSYLIHRLEVHADAHLTDQTRLFVQIENALAPGLAKPGPADVNKLDLRLLFLDTSGPLGSGIYKLRIGRQEMAFDLQRFISVRDGPNVRQAFDAIWGDYEQGAWRLSGFKSRPVQYQNHTDFDDYSSDHITYQGARIQRHVGEGDASITLSNYHQDNAHDLAASGAESRNNIDVHYTGSTDGMDWDAEGMQQLGHVGAKRVNAWGIGSLLGYTFTDLSLKPRLSIQLDAASGNHNPSGTHIETFNPLFPNGYYLNLSGYTGYTNFIHFKPALTLSTLSNMKLFFGLGMLWRQTTRDAIYTLPNIALPNTAGQPGRRSATYGQFRLDWALSRRLSIAFEEDYYMVASAIKNAGGHDSNYLGTELKWGW